MSERTDTHQTSADRWIGIGLLASGLALLVVYADGQAGPTFRFLAEWLVELGLAGP